MGRRDRVLLAGLAAAAAAAVCLRLAGIGYGLPAVFNADEPHHVNVAVSFGRGSLNPGIFKYPTLWMYLLFLAYGAYFLLWSGLGLLHSLREFGELFVWAPGGFYWIARLLSAALSLGALPIVYRTGCLLGDKRLGLWAAALLAVSPPVVESAHAAKPDSLLLFLAACCWHLATRYQLRGRTRDLGAAGAAMGLALATQYIGVTLAAVLPAAWAARGRAAELARRLKPLALAAACAGAAFLAGSPFILLDRASFLRDLRDQSALHVDTPWGSHALAYALDFAGSGALLGGLLLALGAWRLIRSRRELAAFLLFPAAAHLALLAWLHFGEIRRYSYAIFPALALLAGFGAEALRARLGRSGEKPHAFAALLALLMLPGAWSSWAYVRPLLLPDTRSLAEPWLEANIPAGARVLAQREHAAPRLKMSRAQVGRLLEGTRRLGHPRWRYYELMLGSHPGGGWEVLWIRRPAHEMDTGGWHQAWSSSGREMLDLGGGLRAARRAGVQYVVWSSEDNIAGSPALQRLQRELEAKGKLLAEFRPEPGRSRGPHLRIYRVK